MKLPLLFHVFDNISVRNKLLLIYIICVFIPIIFINLIFYNSISRQVRSQELERINLSMERILSGAQRNIEECVGIINTLNSDLALYQALEEKYADHEAYFDTYRHYLENAVTKYEPAYKQVKGISIYTDNETILNGGPYLYINPSIKREVWFEKMSNVNNSIVVTSYEKTEQSGINNADLHMSVIKKISSMNRQSHINKIIKVNLKIESFRDIMLGEKLPGDLFLINDRGEIVCSTNNKYFNGDIREFLSFNTVEIEKNTIVSSKSFSKVKYLKDWKVTGIFPEEKVLTEMKRSRNYVLILTLISLVIVSLIVYFIAHSLNIRLKVLSGQMSRLSEQEFTEIRINEGNDEIGVLIREFNKMAAKIKQLIEDIYQADIQKKSLELERKQAVLNALESQINPHFLYNVLNTVSIKSALKNETETAEVVKCIAKTFRRVISWGNDLITVQEEVNFVKEFLKIQKYRFEDKLEYNVSVEEHLMPYKIPKMTLQPFVENASIHGVERAKNKGRISIHIYERDYRMYCRIKDNGAGMDTERLGKLIEGLKTDGEEIKRIGIRNVYRRLSLYYGESLEFKIESQEDRGTIVIISVPMDKLEKSDLGGVVQYVQSTDC